MRSRFKSSSARGFTLVELLVVIGIIALLISILLPALNSARKQANTVKCSSAMREIGNAIAMYVNDNKGWAPPLRAFGSSATNYYVISYTNWNPPQDQKLANQYWYCFLAKYVTRTMQGQIATTNTGNDRQTSQKNNVIWGCPEWQPYLDSAFTGGTNPNDPGIGFNGFPEYTASYPPKAAPPNTIGDTFPGDLDSHAVSGVEDTNADWGHPQQGRWYRFNKYNNASQRCIVADANWYFVESLAAPLNGTFPGQHVYTDQAVWAVASGTDGETQIDVYRHGKLPNIASTGTSGTYNAVGGKIGFNVLYCDGHASTVTDRSEAYRSTRMRYPG